MHFLVAESETADERARRRHSVGKSSGESYAATLEQMVPNVRISRIAPADADVAEAAPEWLAGFDAIFVTGAPLHVYDDSPEARRQIAFMRAVFASGTPSFGSCAGLQLAVAAAGGTVRSMEDRKEAGIARRILPTEAGRDHPLLAGRGPVWDAPAIHNDEVADLPAGAVLLATNAVTRVQAAEIRCGAGIFWGVQYHPELAPGEIAAALRRQSDDLIDLGLARDEADVEAQASLLDDLHDAPGDQALLWRLGVTPAFADEEQRRTELRNFLTHLVEQVRRERGRAELAMA